MLVYQLLSSIETSLVNQMNIYTKWVKANPSKIRSADIPYPIELDPVLNKIRETGGIPVLAGGCIRDHFLGRKAKDFDILVFGISYPELEPILTAFGHCKFQGAKFGILKLTITKVEYEFACARKETKQGQGRKGFDIELDPLMTPEQETLRRDFTWNALLYDPNLRIVIDCYNGINDLNAGILRHTSEKFAEDVSRVLRGVGFAGRFGFNADPQTIEFCTQLQSEYNTIDVEDIWRIWTGIFLKTSSFQHALKFLFECGWDKFYPGLDLVNNQATLDKLNSAAKLVKSLDLDEKAGTIVMMSILTFSMDKDKTKKRLESFNAPKKYIESVIRINTTIKSIEGYSLDYANIPLHVLKSIVSVCNNTNKDLLNLSVVIQILTETESVLPSWQLMAEQKRVNLLNFQQIVDGQFLMTNFKIFGAALKDPLAKARQAELEGVFYDTEQAMQWCQTRLVKHSSD